MPDEHVAVIESKAGSVRSNHYHKTDSHYLYVVSGKMVYYERAVGDSIIPEPIMVGPGECVFTPPMREHATRFAADTVMISIAAHARTHEAHEADLVRVKFI